MIIWRGTKIVKDPIKEQPAQGEKGGEKRARNMSKKEEPSTDTHPDKPAV